MRSAAKAASSSTARTGLASTATAFTRRRSSGSGSPNALQGVGEERDGGVQPGDHPDGGADVEPGDAVLRGPGPAGELLGLCGGLPLRRRGGVGLHDPAGQPGLEPAPGQRPVHEVHHRRIHRPGRLGREVPGPGRDPAGVPDPGLPGQHAGPDQRQPVPHVEGVGDQLPGGPGADLQPGTQLGPGELRHRRRPGTADPHRALQTRQHRPRRAGRPAASRRGAGPRTPPPARTGPRPPGSGPRAGGTPHRASPRRSRGDRFRCLHEETLPGTTDRNRPGTGVPAPNVENYFLRGSWFRQAQPTGRLEWSRQARPTGSGPGWRGWFRQAQPTGRPEWSRQARPTGGGPGWPEWSRQARPTGSAGVVSTSSTNRVGGSGLDKLDQPGWRAWFRQARPTGLAGVVSTSSTNRVAMRPAGCGFDKLDQPGWREWSRQARPAGVRSTNRCARHQPGALNEGAGGPGCRGARTGRGWPSTAAAWAARPRRRAGRRTARAARASPTARSRPAHRTRPSS